MRCTEALEMMQRYVDHDLQEAEEALLLTHLVQCPECAELMEKLTRLSDELENLPQVMPPFSIVDSILPELDKMRIGGEQSASIEPAASHSNAPIVGNESAVLNAMEVAEPHATVTSYQTGVTAAETELLRTSRSGMKRKRPSRMFSWLWSGGAAAAAIVIGLLLFKQQPLTQQNAESAASNADLMKTKAADTNDKSAKAGSGEPSSAKPDKNTQAVGGMANNATTQAKETPSATPQPSPTVSTKATSNEEIPKKPASSGKTPAASAKSKASATPASTSGTKVTVSGTPESSSSESMAYDTAKTPSDQSHDDIAKGAINEHKVSNGIAPPEATSSSKPAPTPPPAMGIAPDSGSKGKGNLTATETQQLPNKENTLTAFVRDKHVIVTDRSNGEVYVSQQWDKSKAIRLVGWSGSTLLYEVDMEDGSVKQQQAEMLAR